MRAAVVTLVIGVAIGIAAGRWSAPGGAPFTVDHRPEAQSPLASAPIDVERPITAAAPASADALLRRAIEALPAPPSEQGTEKISGHVRLRDGAPVEGAEVVAIAEKAAGGDPGTTAESGAADIARDARRLLERLRARASASHHAATDAAGAFRIEGLAPGLYALEGRRDGFEIDGAAASAGETVTLEARRALRLPVEVLTPDGAVAERATLSVAPAEDDDRTAFAAAWHPDAPTVAIEPGAWQIAARAGAHDALRSPAVRIQVSGRAPPAPVTLHLAQRCGILATVRIPDDEMPRSGGVYVRAVRYDGGPLPEPTDGSGSVHGWPGEPIVAWVDGPGRYAVWAGRKEIWPVVTRVMEIGEGLVPLDVTLEPLAGGGAITVRVQDPAGAPLDGEPDFYLAGRVDGKAPDMVSTSDLHMRDGSWRLTIEPPATLAGLAEATLSVRAKAFGRKEVALARGQGNVIVRFDAPATLDVHVPGLSASVVGSVEAQVTSVDGTFDTPSVELDAEGHAAFEGLPPGTYEAVLSVGNLYRTEDTSSRTRMELRAGQNEVTMHLSPVSDLVVDAAPGQTVYLARGPGAGSIIDQGKAFDGEPVRFRNLLAGRYALTGYEVPGSMEVTVPASGPVRFAPTPTTALYVKGVNPKGPFAESGLAAGDYIVEVGGSRLESEEAFVALAASLPVGPTPVRVVRGGATISLTVALGGLRALDGLVPAHPPGDAR